MSGCNNMEVAVVWGTHQASVVAKNAAWGPPNPIGTPNLEAKEGKEERREGEEKKKREERKRTEKERRRKKRRREKEEEKKRRDGEQR